MWGRRRPLRVAGRGGARGPLPHPLTSLRGPLGPWMRTWTWVMPQRRPLPRDPRRSALPGRTHSAWRTRRSRRSPKDRPARCLPLCCHRDGTRCAGRVARNCQYAPPLGDTMQTSSVNRQAVAAGTSTSTSTTPMSPAEPTPAQGGPRFMGISRRKAVQQESRRGRRCFVQHALSGTMSPISTGALHDAQEPRGSAPDAGGAQPAEA